MKNVSGLSKQGDTIFSVIQVGFFSKTLCIILEGIALLFNNITTVQHLIFQILSSSLRLILGNSFHDDLFTASIF